MKKGLKQRISLILIMAMVITMSMPVSARENRSVFDDTHITEEPSSDRIAIEEEPAPANLQASDSVSIETERDAVGSDGDVDVIPGLILNSGWRIAKLIRDDSRIIEANLETGDYSYDNTNNANTITIKKSINPYGLIIYATTQGNTPLNLVWEASDNAENPNNVPVTLAVDEGFTGIGTIYVSGNEANTTKQLRTISSETTLAVAMCPNTSDPTPGTTSAPPGFEYISGDIGFVGDAFTDGVTVDGSCCVYVTPASEVLPLTGDAVTINSNSKDADLIFKKQNNKPVLGVANIPNSDYEGAGIDYNPVTNTWNGTGVGRAVILYGDGTGNPLMKTLSFEELELCRGDSGPQEQITVTSVGSNYITGTISHVNPEKTYANLEKTYTVATFNTEDKTNMTSAPAIVDENGNFTITGLASSTQYFVAARVVSDDPDTRYQICEETSSISIPSGWTDVAGPVTTSAPPVTRYSVIVDQTSLNGSTKYVTGNIPSTFSEYDSTFTFTGIPEDTEQYTFDGWQYRFANEEETVRHDVEPDEQGKYVIDVKGKRQKLYLYAKWSEKVSAVTLRLNDQELDTISISNEIAKTETASLTDDCAVVKIELMPQPADAQETLTIEPDGTGFYGMGLTAEDARKQVFAEEKLSIPYVTPGEDGKQTRTLYVAAAKSGFNDTPVNKWKEEGRRSGVVKLSVKNGTKELSAFTVCINGYDVEAEGYYENGALVKSTALTTESRQVAGKTVNFDTDGVRISALTVAPATLYLPVGGAAATLKADGSDDDIIWNVPEKIGGYELFASAVPTQKDSTNNKAHLKIVTGADTGSYTFTAQENNFPISSGKVSQNAKSVVSVFGLSGTVTGSDTPAFGLKDTVAPGKWDTYLNYSTGTDGKVSADSMILTISGGDLAGAPKTGTITLTSSNEKVVKADSSTLTLTAVGPGVATVTVVYDNTVAAQDAGAKVTLALEVHVGDRSHTEHHWVLEKNNATWMFDWGGTTPENKSAKASFCCTDGYEIEIVTAQVDVITDDISSATEDQSKGLVVYEATVTDPAGVKTYTENCWFKVWRERNSDGTWGAWNNNGIKHGLPGIEVSNGRFLIRGLEEKYTYTGQQIKPAFTVWDCERDVQLAEGVDYTVKYGKNKKVDTDGTVTVRGKGNYYTDTKNPLAVAKFKIVMPDTTDMAAVNKAKIAKIADMVYTGEPLYPEKISITTKDGKDDIVIVMKHVGDGDYAVEGTGKAVAVTVTNNVNKGKGVVAVTGSDNKTVSKKFTIKAADLSAAGGDLVIEAGSGEYAVKGAKSDLHVSYKDKDLVQGQDFSVKYTYTSKNKDAGEKMGHLQLVGKKNFTKKSTIVDFDITSYELKDEMVAVDVYKNVKGEKLKAYTEDGEGVQIPSKQLVVTSNKTGKLNAGDEIEVTVKGANEKNISGEVTLHLTVSATKFSQAKVSGLSGKDKYFVYYTGEPIDFEQMKENPFATGKISLQGYEYGSDYEIAGYANNIKKGTMIVFLQAKGEKASGMKKVKVQIKAKTI